MPRTLTVAIDVDTYLDANAPTTPQGGNTSVNIGNVANPSRTALQVTNLYSVNPYFRPGARVLSASLKLRWTSPATFIDAASQVVDVEMILSSRSMSEANATWNNYASGLAWTAPGGDVAVVAENFTFALPSSTPSGGAEYVISGFGPMVQRALTYQNGLLGFRMKLATESGTRLVAWASDEHASLDPPIMEVVLAIPSPVISIGSRGNIDLGAFDSEAFSDGFGVGPSAPEPALTMDFSRLGNSHWTF